MRPPGRPVAGARSLALRPKLSVHLLSTQCLLPERKGAEGSRGAGCPSALWRWGGGPGARCRERAPRCRLRGPLAPGWALCQVLFFSEKIMVGETKNFET